MKGMVRPLCSSTAWLAPPKPSLCSLQKLCFAPCSTQLAYFTLFSTTPSGFPSFVIYAAPDSQLSEEVETVTREWDIQDFYSLRKDVENASERVEEIVATSDLQLLEQELADLESKAADSSFWDDRTKAQEVLLALTDVKEKIKMLNEFKTKAEDAKTIIELTEEMDSTDSALLEEATGIIKELNEALDLFELTQLLSGPCDKEGAVISITAEPEVLIVG